MLGLAIGLAMAAVIASPAIAFDTAPHANITEQAMALQGYEKSAADVVQVENWLTDYYTSTPTFPSSQQCYLEKLHFDDVFTNADVDAYWKTLLRNTIAAAAKAKADNDYIEYYTVLGVSLHVVQDFYAHSDWVESSGFGGPGYDTTTYFEWARNPWPRTSGVFTGWYANCLNIPQGNHQPHGGYTSGLNHDSVVRPNYNRAYVYALAASEEWLAQIRKSVDAAPGDPNFGANALHYRPGSSDAAALARDQAASLYISEWIENPVNQASLDGHWNGNHSGYTAAFAAFSAAWTALPDSLYVRTFKQRAVYVALSQGLYAPFTGQAPPMDLLPLTGTAVRMQVARVCANYSVGTESYFGQVTASHYGSTPYPIRDAAQIHRPCTDVPWQYITVVPPFGADVSFRYTFWNEYGLPAPGAGTAPISGGSNDLTFNCRFSPAACTWGVTGGQQQSMPSRLDISGSGFQGVSVKGITIELSQLSNRRQ
jgi:hypothetical protein